MKINPYYADLNDNYLFSTIRKKVQAYKAQNPAKQIISLGIGDVTQPLPALVVQAMKAAAAEMGEAHSFRGYGDEQGYGFLRKAVCDYYAKKAVALEEDEVFISDGAKSDLGNILDIFAQENTVLIPNPVYPVYVDTNIMAGRKIEYAMGNEENHFLPLPDANTDADIIYLCSPNNPTGAVYNRAQLKAWVDYALEREAIILFDSAYEAFISDDELPTSIYQIDGAMECAIEFCSLSKTAGFTGVRCGYTVIPKTLIRNDASLNKLWLRRQTTKFNGVSYVVQRGAEAVFSHEGLARTRENIQVYKGNAQIIAKRLEELGICYTGGAHSPYLWMKCPNGMRSWAYFDFLLNNANIIGTPGVGFGSQGEGFFRLSSFGNREDVLCAVQRLCR